MQNVWEAVPPEEVFSAPSVPESSTEAPEAPSAAIPVDTPPPVEASTIRRRQRASATSKTSLRTYVKQKAAELGIPPTLADALVEQESGYDPKAVSSAGAKGIMQVVHEANPDIPETDNPREQADYGLAKLAKLKNTYKHPGVALMAYNYGDGNTAKLILDKFGIEYKDNTDAVNKLLSSGVIDKLPKDESFTEFVLGDSGNKETYNYLKKLLPKWLQAENEGPTPERAEAAKSSLTTPQKKAIAEAAVYSPEELAAFMNEYSLQPDLAARGIGPRYMPQEQAGVSDIFSAFGAGGVSALAGVTALANMLAPEGGTLDEVTERARQFLNDKAEAIMYDMPYEAQEKLRKEFLTTEDSAFTDPLAWWLKLGQNAPMVAASIAAYTLSTYAGLSAAGAVAAGSVLEGVLGGADTANQITEEINNLSKEEFRKRFPEYADLPEEQAREAAVNKARIMSVPVVMLVDTAASMFGLRKLDDVVKANKGFFKRGLTGAKEEVLTEMPQSGTEQLFTNLGAREPDPTKGVGEAIVQGGAVAGPFGFTGGALSRPPQEQGESDDTTGDTGSNPTLPSDEVPPDVAAAVRAKTEEAPYASPQMGLPFGPLPESGGGSGGGGVVEPSGQMGLPGFPPGGPAPEQPQPSGVSPEQMQLFPEEGAPEQGVLPLQPGRYKALPASEQIPEEQKRSAEELRRKAKRRYYERLREAFNKPRDEAAKAEAERVQRRVAGEFAGQEELGLDEPYQPGRDTSQPQQLNLPFDGQWKNPAQERAENRERKSGVSAATEEKEKRAALRKIMAQAAVDGNASDAEVREILLGDPTSDKFVGWFKRAMQRYPEEVKQNLPADKAEKLFQALENGRLKKASVVETLNEQISASKKRLEAIDTEEKAEAKDEESRSALEKELATLQRRKLARGKGKLSLTRKGPQSLKRGAKPEEVSKPMAERRKEIVAAINRKIAEVEKKLNEIKERQAAREAKGKARSRKIDRDLQRELLKDYLAELEAQRREVSLRDFSKKDVAKVIEEIRATALPDVVRKEDASNRQLDMFQKEKTKEERKAKKARVDKARIKRAGHIQSIIDKSKKKTAERKERIKKARRQRKEELVAQKQRKPRSYKGMPNLEGSVDSTDLTMTHGISVYPASEVFRDVGTAPNLVFARALALIAKDLRTRVREKLSNIVGLVKGNVLRGDLSAKEVKAFIATYIGKRGGMPSGEPTKVSKRELHNLISNIVDHALARKAGFKGYTAKYLNSLTREELIAEVYSIRKGEEGSRLAKKISDLVDQKLSRIAITREKRATPPTTRDSLHSVLAQIMPVEMVYLKILKKYNPKAYRSVVRQLPRYVANAVNKFELPAGLTFEQAVLEARENWEINKEAAAEKYALPVPDVAGGSLSSIEALELTTRVKELIPKLKKKISSLGRSELRDIGLDLLGIQKLLGVDLSMELSNFLTVLDTTPPPAFRAADKKALIKQLRGIMANFVDMVALQAELVDEADSARMIELQQQIDAIEFTKWALPGTPLGKVLNLKAEELTDEATEEPTNEEVEENGTDTEPPAGESDEGGAGSTETVGEAEKETSDDELHESYASVPSNAQIDGVSKGLKRILSGKNFMIADSTGTGKTTQMLMLANEFLKKKRGPVVIVIKNRDHESNFRRDAARLGIPRDADIQYWTYQDMSKTSSDLAGMLESMPKGLVIFDESQNIKRQDVNSQYYKAYKAMVSGDIPVVFATATPMDNLAHINLLASLEGISAKELANRLGYALDAKGEVSFSSMDSATLGQVLENLTALVQKHIDEGAISVNTPERDITYKTETLKPEGLEVVFTDGATAPLDEVESGIKDEPNTARRMAMSKYAAELAKLPAVAERVAKELSRGRKVIVWVSRQKPTTIRIEGKEKQLPPPAEVLSKLLEAKGIKSATVVGSAGSAATREAFQEGDLDVLISTPQKLGVGFDLDDQTGEHPRTAIFTNYGFSAIELDQAIGRISRKNTQSQSEAVFFATDTFTDNRQRVSLAVKTEVLKASRGGETAKLPSVSELEADMARPYAISEAGDGKVNVVLNTAFFRDDYGTWGKAQNALARAGGKFNPDSGVSTVPEENAEALQEELDEIVAGIAPWAGKEEKSVPAVKTSRPSLSAKWRETAGALRGYVNMLRERGEEITSAKLLKFVKRNAKLSGLRKLADVLLKTGVDLPISLEADLGGTEEAPVMGKYAFTPDAQGKPTNRRIRLREDNISLKVFLHEMVHAVTLHALTRNSNLARRVNVIFRKFVDAADKYGINVAEHGLTDVGEFVAELVANPEFQQAAREIAYVGDQSLWSRFKNIVHKSIKFLTGWEIKATKSYMDMLEEALEVSYEMFQTDAQVQEAQIHDHFFSEFREAAGEHAATLGANYVEAIHNTFERTIGGRSVLRRKVKLPFMTGRQIAESYKDRFSSFKPTFFNREVNALEHVMRLQGMKDQEVHRTQLKTFPLARTWEEYDVNNPEKSLALGEVMSESTRAEMDVSVSFDDAANKHLRESADGKPLDPRVVAANRKRYDELRKKYDSNLDDTGRQIYVAAKEYFASRWAELVNAVKFNMLYDKGVIEALGLNTATDLELYVQTLNNTKAVDDMVDAMVTAGFDEKRAKQLKADLKEVVNRARIKGVYFPLRRFGDYVVTGYGEEVVKVFETAAEAAIQKELLQQEDPDLDIGGIHKTEQGTYSFVAKPKIVQFFESASEAEQFRNQLIEKGFTKVSNVMHKEGYYQQERVSSAFIDRATANVKDEQLRGALRLALLQMMPEGSIRKAEMFRKGIAGASTDMLRAYAAHSRASAHYLAQMKYGVRIQETMQEMHRQASENKYDAGVDTMTMQDVVNELRIRDMLASQMPFRNRFEIISELGFISYLTSPSYWMINATQPWLITLPWLAARYGMRDSRRAMTAAMQAVSPEVLSKMSKAKGGFGWAKGEDVPPELFDFLTNDGSISEELSNRIAKSDKLTHKDGIVQMLKELGESNLINMTFAADIRALAEGVSQSKYTRGKKFVMDWARIMPHLIEVLNRTTTAAAAYELARSKGMNHEEATKIAEQAVATTQFDYSAVNKPRYFSDKQFALARPVFMFMQHTQHMYYLMLRSMLLDGLGKKALKSLLGQGPALTAEEKEKARTAIKTFLYVTASHMAVAGTLGGLFEPIKWAIGLAMMMLSAIDGDDDYFDPEVRYRQLLEEMFGKKGGMVVAKGLPTMFNVDLSTRINLNRLMFFSSPVKGEGREAVWSFVEAIGGPSLSMALNIAEGFKNLREGDTLRGIEQIAMPVPKLFRDSMKAFRYASRGLLDSSGNTLMPAKDFTPWDLFQQSMGLPLAHVSEFYEERRAVTDAARYYRRKKSQLLESLYRASPSERARIRAVEIPRYNRSVPSVEMKIKYKDIKSYMRRKESSQERMDRASGARLTKRERALAREYGGFSGY